MRLSPVVPTLAGLLLAWAVVAQADAPPPAAPIFYCPTPGKAAPATPAKTPAKPVVAPVIHTSAPHAQGCPTMRVAVEGHHWRREERHYAVAPPPMPQFHRHHDSNHGHGALDFAGGTVVHSNDADVSAAQAFIYRYERARHGLDAGAAEQAWAEGRRGASMGGHVLAQRQTPPPMMAERGPPPPMAQRGPPAPTMPAPQGRAYAWQDGHAGGGYSVQRTERAGGWSYAERDGQGRYRQWGDHFAGEPGHGWGESAERRGPCPHACGAPHGQVEAYESAGRDAAGFLTWPGKTPGW